MHYVVHFKSIPEREYKTKFHSRRVTSLIIRFAMEFPPPPIPSSPPPLPPYPPPPIPQFYAEATIATDFSESIVNNDIVAPAAFSLHEPSSLPIARQLDQSSFTTSSTDFHDSPSYDNSNHEDSHLIKDSAPLDVTDKDFFLRLGYSETNIRKALIITSGDRNAALHILSRSMAGLEGYM